jgi:hypothetical protein
VVRSQRHGPTEAVLVLTTLGAPERRRRSGRRSRAVKQAEPEAVPTARASVVRPEPFRSREQAAAWLARLGGDEEAVLAELDAALTTLNKALRAQRAAAADPYVAEVSASRALVARVGYGGGEAVAEGRFGEALELPRAGGRRVKRSMETPEERFAALLGAREEALVAEELVLRARLDLDAGRLREAALQARVALEALIAEVGPGAGELGGHRAAVAEAANEALRGDVRADDVQEAVAAMEGVLRRHRLGA